MIPKFKVPEDFVNSYISIIASDCSTEVALPECQCISKPPVLPPR